LNLSIILTILKEIQGVEPFLFGVILEKPFRVEGSDDVKKAKWISLKKYLI